MTAWRGPGAALLLVVLLGACSGGGPSAGSGTPTGAGSPSASTGPAAGSSAGSPSASASSPGPAPSASGTAWATYHGNGARTGAAASPAAVRALRVVRSVRLDGAVYAQPVVAPGPGGPVVVAATEANSVYAIRGGRVVWRARLGAPVPLSALPCGNIDPLGVTGTPVVDPASRTVYVVAELAGPVRHELVALDTGTGLVRWRRDVDVPGAQPGAEQQRAALALSGGRVWVAMGGLFGDCGPYVGKVVGVRTDGGGGLAVYRVPTAREGGIWAPSGPAVGPQGHLFVAVGNGEATSGAWDGSDSILELDTSARLVSSFAPAGWAKENASDLDLGSMGPLLLPGGLVVASGKGGDVYVLRQGALGGIGRPLVRWPGCAAFGGAAADVRGSGAGTVVAYLPCTDGVAALRVTLATGAVTRLWEAQVTGSPVVAGDAVLALEPSAGSLVALDAATGRPRATAQVGEASRFATPLLDGAIAYVGTLTGLTEVALS